MAARSLLWPLLALSLALALSGCSAPAGPAGDDAGGSDGDDDAGDGKGPFFGFAPGVSALPLPEGSAGTVEGHTFDVSDGAPIGRATVLATCIRQALPAVDGPVPQPVVAFAGADGHFVMSGLDGFAACHSIEYTIQAAGYTMTVPLSSGHITPGTQYLVHAGMTAAK